MAQLSWTRGVEEALRDDGLAGLAQYREVLDKQLLSLVELVRGALTRVQRCTLEALVVIDVHNRDTVAEMIRDECVDAGQFAWCALRVRCCCLTVGVVQLQYTFARGYFWSPFGGLVGGAPGGSALEECSGGEGLARGGGGGWQGLGQ